MLIYLKQNIDAETRAAAAAAEAEANADKDEAKDDTKTDSKDKAEDEHTVPDPADSEDIKKEQPPE